MQTHNGAEASHVLHDVKALTPQVRDAADAIEEERRLLPPVVQAMKEAGVFRLAIPRAYGGLELDPMTQVRVVEICPTWTVRSAGVR